MEKIIKYKQYLQFREFRLNQNEAGNETGDQRIRILFAVIAVGVNHVCSNVNLPNSMISELSMRLRFALSLQPSLVEQKLVNEIESDLSKECKLAKLELISFDFSKFKTDSMLIREGFPEYTKMNYKTLISKPCNKESFTYETDSMLGEAIKRSGFIECAESPLRAREYYDSKLEGNRSRYHASYNSYTAKMNTADRRLSRKRLVLLPFVVINPSLVDYDNEVGPDFQNLCDELKNYNEENDGPDLQDPLTPIGRKRMYLALWAKAMGEIEEEFDSLKSKKQSEADAAGDLPCFSISCNLEDCTVWSEHLEEMKSEEEILDYNDEADLNLMKLCHDLDSAISGGGVSKAANDRTRYRRIKLAIDEEERVALATVGLQGKALKDDIVVSQAKVDSKKTILFDSPVDDIDDYLEGWFEMQIISDVNPPLGYQAMCSLVERSLMQQATVKSTDHPGQLLKDLITSRIGLAAYLMSSIMMEINASIKQHCKRDQFILKRLREFPVWVLIKPTNSQSHIFFSLYWNSDSEVNIISNDDKSRKTTRPFGEILSFTEGACITPFYSVNKSKIPNLCQAYPRLINLMSYGFDESKLVPPGVSSSQEDRPIFSFSEEDWTEENLEEELAKFRTSSPGSHYQRVRKFWKLTLLNWLIGLHNKAEVEEHLTMTRFIFMEGFVHEPAVTNPGKMVPKYTEKLRSRLTIWVIKKLHELIEKIFETKGFRLEQSKIRGTRRAKSSRSDMENPFINEVIEDEGEAINCFYYGYVVDKNQIPERNMSAQLYEKILAYEDKFTKEDVGVIGCREPDDLLNVPFHHYSINMIKGMCSAGLEIIRSRSGLEPLNRVEDAVLNKYARATIFDTLSTMKSSTTFDSSTEDPDSKYPRRMKLLQASKDKIYSGKSMMYEILLDSLKTLVTESCIYNDLFKKNQHGGLREIYIMNSDTRVVQHFIETCSRAICELFPSETMTNPDSKTALLERHNDLVRVRYKRNPSVTLCTSDDARKWNQGHYVHKFYVMMVHMMPKEYHELFRAICYLWQNKKILIDEDLLKTFKSHPDLKFDSDSIQKMYKIYRGEEEPSLWMENGSRYIRVRTGMMQGILHYTSSLFHTLANEFIRLRVIALIKGIIKKNPSSFLVDMAIQNSPSELESVSEPVVTILQSSDDSAMAITIPYTEGYTQKIASFFSLSSFIFKHLFGASIGIHLSEKSSSNLLNIMEFNSVWYFLGNRFQPYLKQCLASLTVSEHGNLMMRMQENYNAITSALENGASFLCCSGLQAAQAIQHYMFLGATMTHNFLHYAEYMDELMLPTLGFFLMDNPSMCGLAGLECLHYILARKTMLRHYYRLVYEKCEKVKNLEEKNRVINDETVAPSLHNQICLISHGQNMKLAKLKMAMDIEETWLEDVNEDPTPLTRRPLNQKEAMLKVAAKLHAPGMSNSFNSMGIFSNIAAESIYILSSKCNQVQNPSNLMKMSSYSELITKRENEKWSMKLRSSEAAEGEDDVAVHEPADLEGALKTPEITQTDESQKEEGKFTGPSFLDDETHDKETGIRLGESERVNLGKRNITRSEPRTKKRPDQHGSQNLDPVSSKKLEPKHKKSDSDGKYSLLFLCEAIRIANNSIKREISVMNDEERLIYDNESRGYLDMCFARYEDYEIILDHQDSLASLRLYRDDKSLRNRFMKVKVSSSTLDDGLKPYDVVVWKLLGSRTISDARAGRHAWAQLKRQYKWLKETWEETLLDSPFTDSLQLLNFLSRLDKSGRVVKLQGISMFQVIPGDQILNLIGCNMLKGHSTNLLDSLGSKDRTARLNAESGLLESSNKDQEITAGGSEITQRVAGHCLAMCSMMGLKSESMEAISTIIADKTRINLDAAGKRAKTLAVLLSFLSGTTDCKETIMLCERKNIGLLGGYSIVQKYDILSKQYHGYGLWEGSYCGVSISIYINSRSTGVKIDANELIARKKELESVNPHQKVHYKFGLQSIHESYIMKIVLQKELNPKELISLIKNWCEGNQVSTSLVPTRDDYRRFELLRIGVREVSATREALMKNFRETPDEKGYAILKDNSIIPFEMGSSENPLGAPIFINKNYRLMSQKLETLAQDDLSLEVKDGLTFRFTLSNSRTVEEYSTEHDSYERRSLLERKRSSFVVLSFTPGIQDLVSSHVVRRCKNVGLPLENMREWVMGESLTVKEATGFLRDLARPEGLLYGANYFKGPEIRSIAQMQCKQWLRDRNILRDNPTSSSGEEMVSNYKSATITPGIVKTGADSFRWVLDGISNIQTTLLDLANPETNSGVSFEQIQQSYSSGNDLAFWTEAIVMEDDEEESTSRVGHRSVDLMKKKQYLENHKFLHKFFENIPITAWVQIVKDKILPYNLKDLKEVLEFLLSSSVEKKTLTVEQDFSRENPFSFPTLGESMRKAGKRKKR